MITAQERTPFKARIQFEADVRAVREGFEELQQRYVNTESAISSRFEELERRSVTVESALSERLEAIEQRSADAQSTVSEREADDDGSTVKRCDNPLDALSYGLFKQDMQDLARFVKVDGFVLILDVSLPPTASLIEEYKQLCPMLNRQGAVSARVLEALDRWSVPPKCIREVPLSSEDVAEADKLTGCSVLEALCDNLLDNFMIQWVSENPAEPAVFWKPSYLRASSRR